MARARRIRGLTASSQFGHAAAIAVRVRTDEVFGFASAAADGRNAQGLRDMRIATRRLRAALEVFAPCFPAAEHGALLAEVKHLAGALGERRDPDVAIDWLTGFGSGLDPADRPGVAGLVSALRDEHAVGHLATVDALERVGVIQLEQRLLELAETARQPGVAS